MAHIPVLKKEVIGYLDPKPNENFIDCTFGQGGHSEAILEKTGSRGKVLGIDWNPETLKNTRYAKRLILICDNFANLKEIVKRLRFSRVSGILFDLGMSSWHLKSSSRGFTFLKNEPLDMRYSSQNPLTAEKIMNYWSRKDIERILTEYGEERFAEQISKKIIETREVKQIKSTLQLVSIIKKAVPGWYQRQRINPATKTFQALRIAVNDELDNLMEALPQALEILEPGGRLAVISFHSLEDRIVKNFLKENSKVGRLKILIKKPVRPTREEITLNPRSRSSRLRMAVKI